MSVFAPLSTYGMIPGPGPSGAAAGAVSGVPVLTAKPSGTDAIVLNLTPPADDDYVQCKIFRWVAGGQAELLTTYDTGAYTDSDVTAEIVYYYQALPVNADGVPGLPSQVAYARCTNWTAADFAFTNASPSAIDLGSNFGRLLYRTCQTVHELDLFALVLPFAEDAQTFEHPTCIVTPLNDPEETEDAAQRIYKVWYRFRLGLVVIGEDGGRLALQALSLRQSLKRAFRGTAAAKVIYSDVVRHYNTNVTAEDMSLGLALSAAAVAFDTGLQIEYLVQEIRGQQ